MSGGYFDYRDRVIEEIIGKINEIIWLHEKKKENDYKLNDSTIRRLHDAIGVLEKASVYCHRIDWLLSYDDSEETFHELLKKDLDELNGITPKKIRRSK